MLQFHLKKKKNRKRNIFKTHQKFGLSYIILLIMKYKKKSMSIFTLINMLRIILFFLKRMYSTMIFFLILKIKYNVFYLKLILLNCGTT